MSRKQNAVHAFDIKPRGIPEGLCGKKYSTQNVLKTQNVLNCHRTFSRKFPAFAHIPVKPSIHPYSSFSNNKLFLAKKKDNMEAKVLKFLNIISEAIVLDHFLVEI